MRLLAIDFGSHCGFAHSYGISGTWDLSIRKDESGGMRLLRFRAKLDEILEKVGVDLVGFEAIRFSGMHGAVVPLAELQSVLKVWCEDHRVNFRGFSPSEVKKHFSGKGNAGKPQMREAAKKSLWNFREEMDDNEIDALAVLSLVTSELGGG